MFAFAFIGSSKISIPLISAVPEVEEIYPVSIFIVVDFPAPLGPKNPRISPSSTVKLISFTAILSP